jgi:Helix-turn-helix family
MISTMIPIDVIRGTAPQLNAVGGSSYFNEAALAAGTEIGLKGFPFYFAGRAGVMGNVDAAVVTSAFGYFHPDVVAERWRKATAVVEPAVAGRAYLAAAAAHAPTVLAGLDGLDEFSDAAEAIRAATSHAGLTLFAAIDAHRTPAETTARAYHNAIVLRELRGSVHLVAILANGLCPEVAHAIRRPDDTATFGWDPAPTATDLDRDRLARADELTDALLVPAVETLRDAQIEAFAAGAAAMAAAVSG